MKPVPRALLLVALVLAAINLRPGITSLAPLIERIAAELSLSRSFISLTTALPVLCMGLRQHAQHAGHKGMQCGRAGETHGQPARLAAGGTAHHFGQPIGAGKQRPGLFQQRQPRRRGPHA